MIENRKSRTTWTRITLLCVVAVLGCSLSLTTANAETETSQTSEVMPERLDMVETKVEDLQARIDKYVSWVKWFGGLGAIALSVGAYFGWASLKSAIKKVVELNLEREVTAAVEQELPRRLSATQARAEDFLLRLAKLLALRSMGAYDDALSEYGWNGDVSSLRKESPTLRRAIIECLYAGRRNRTSNRLAAWEAIFELIQDDETAETNRLFLRLAVSTRRYTEGLQFYDRLKTSILDDRESTLRAATLLRKRGRVSEALDIAERYASEEDMTASVTIAVLQRDLGKFDDVHDILLPQANRLIEYSYSELPEGWHRVVNTFIANCLDRGRPEDAVTAAEFVARSAPGAVEIFTVGRLILELPEDHPSRTALEEKFREIVPRLLPGEATTRCMVVLSQLDKDPSAGISILKEAIERGRLPQGEGMKPDVYFQRCHLGQILNGMNRYDEAIDTLMPAASFIYGGEAKFHLAVAYAMKNERLDAARWIGQAIQESPKWAAHARDNEHLRRVPEVLDKLAEVGRPQ